MPKFFLAKDISHRIVLVLGVVVVGGMGDSRTTDDEHRRQRRGGVTMPGTHAEESFDRSNIKHDESLESILNWCITGGLNAP